MSPSAANIDEELQATRRELAATLAAIADQVAPKKVAARGAAKAKTAVLGAVDTVKSKVGSRGGAVELTGPGQRALPPGTGAVRLGSAAAAGVSPAAGGDGQSLPGAEQRKAPQAPEPSPVLTGEYRTTRSVRWGRVAVAGAVVAGSGLLVYRRRRR